MTMDIFAAVVAEFDWPAPYTLEDELPDGILLAFPSCELLFMEGCESEIIVRFPVARTGWPYSLELSSVLFLIGAEIASRSGGLRRLDLLNDRSLTGSVEKVRNGIHDQCTILLAYCQHIILGDFSWVEVYRQAYERNRQEIKERRGW